MSRFSSYNGTQDSSLFAISRAWDSVMRQSYGGEGEDMVGPELWGAANFDGLYENRLVHTGLVGTADRRNDVVRQRFSSPNYYWEPVTLFGAQRVGIYMQYFLEDREDFRPELDFAPMLAGELSALVRDAEEEDYFHPYNTGETWMTSRQNNSPLFVDDATGLTLIGEGRPALGHGNIFYGAPSYGLIEQLNQYGELFINEEGRGEMIRVDRIVGSRRNIELLRRYYDSTFNIDTGNPNIFSPIEGQPVPTLIATDRLYNRNDLIVFYEGWQNDLLSKTWYRGRVETGVFDEDVPQFHYAWSQVRSRYGFYAINNRRVALVKGAAVLP